MSLAWVTAVNGWLVKKVTEIEENNPTLTQLKREVTEAAKVRDMASDEDTPAANAVLDEKCTALMKYISRHDKGSKV